MKKFLCMHRFILLLILTLVSVEGRAWWNDAWPSRKQLTVDASITGADIQGTVQDFPVLVRLHSGNFGFFLDLAENGKDLRFMQQDKTALKHDVEKIDSLVELGLVWVKLPVIRGGISSDNFTMYYGNANAANGSDPQGIYDVNQVLTYHFKEGEALPQDATAYLLHANDSKAIIDPNGYIAAAARFEGQGGIKASAQPALEIDPENGWTFSTWIRTEQEQNATILQAKDATAQLEIKLQGAFVQASYQNGSGSANQTGAISLTPGQWQHLALVVEKNNLLLYLDGVQVANAPIALKPFSPALLIGSSEAGAHLTGWLDEVQIAKIARSPDWIKLQFRSQSPDFTVINFGSDESAEGGASVSYGRIILENLTVDGWVVIALCGVMLVVGLMVMIGKGVTLKQARKENAAFLYQYRNINVSNLDSLDHDENEQDQPAEDSDFLAMFGKHDHFQGSPIYRVYHVGVQELRKRINGNQTALSSEALNVIRARLDAAVVREHQKLNKNMVLLTISISGGPFLGLLGTVMGVMITFAVIAATGDVNINSIAPGISAALAATVAGLAVAIPTLFAYNYLLVQIKDITADMHVFTDEFLAVVSERIAERQKRSES